jgi:hypothetical protein
MVCLNVGAAAAPPMYREPIAHFAQNVHRFRYVIRNNADVIEHSYYKRFLLHLQIADADDLRYKVTGS